MPGIDESVCLYAAEHINSRACPGVPSMAKGEEALQEWIHFTTPLYKQDPSFQFCGGREREASVCKGLNKSHL